MREDKLKTPNLIIVTSDTHNTTKTNARKRMFPCKFLILQHVHSEDEGAMVNHHAKCVETKLSMGTPTSYTREETQRLMGETEQWHNAYAQRAAP